MYLYNPYIIIPELIQYSENIIIMTYEEGIYYNNLDVNNYKKGKIVSLFDVFHYDCLFNHNFFNADLHNGNWKIRYNKNLGYRGDYQLIIY